jgi:hypothetical protein
MSCFSEFHNRIQLTPDNFFPEGLSYQAAYVSAATISCSMGTDVDVQRACSIVVLDRLVRLRYSSNRFLDVGEGQILELDYTSSPRERSRRINLFILRR